MVRRDSCGACDLDVSFPALGVPVLPRVPLSACICRRLRASESRRPRVDCTWLRSVPRYARSVGVQFRVPGCWGLYLDLQQFQRTDSFSTMVVDTLVCPNSWNNGATLVDQ